MALRAATMATYTVTASNMPTKDKTQIRYRNVSTTGWSGR
jgi:hypothetical protein